MSNAYNSKHPRAKNEPNIIEVSPHRAAIFMNLMPIIVLVFSALVLGERISTVQTIGTAVVIGGVILTTRF